MHVCPCVNVTQCSVTEFHLVIVCNPIERSVVSRRGELLSPNVLRTVYFAMSLGKQLSFAKDIRI